MWDYLRQIVWFFTDWPLFTSNDMTSIMIQLLAAASAPWFEGVFRLKVGWYVAIALVAGSTAASMGFAEYYPLDWARTTAILVSGIWLACRTFRRWRESIL